MTIEMGVSSLTVGGTIWTFDNVEFRGKAGETSSTVGLLTPTPNETVWNVAMTRCRWWKYGANVIAGSPRIGIFRNNEFARGVSSFLVAVKNKVIGNSDVDTPTFAFTALAGYAAPTVAGQVEDTFIAYNDFRKLRGRAYSPVYLDSATAGTPNPSLRRFAMIGNIMERIGADPQPFQTYGEGFSATMSYNIMEHNTFVAERSNLFYSDPFVSTLADADTKLNQAFVNRVANNFFDWMPTKHDDFFEATTAALRGNGNGYRPQMVEAWSMLYGVGHEGNVDASRVDSNFRLEFSGLRSATGYAGQLNPQFTDDRSIEGPDGAAATGGGDYRPLAASPLLARVVRANADVDFAGVTRIGAAAAGALEAVASGLGIIAASTTDAVVAAGRLAGLDVSGNLALNDGVAAGALRGLEILASLAVDTVVSMEPPVAHPWGITLGGTVALGDLAAGLTADLHAVATVAAALSAGARLAASLAADPALAAALTVPSGFAADLHAVATVTASLQDGALLAAALDAGSSLAAALVVGRIMFADLQSAALLVADLQTAWPVAAGVSASATITADLTVGKVFGAQLSTRPIAAARLFTRAKFPFEEAPGADRPRAHSQETLDALLWRFTGQRSVEAILAANPGLADLGPFLPAGHAVDLTAAETAPAPAIRELVQLWD
jgi:phage tail protein X